MSPVNLNLAVSFLLNSTQGDSNDTHPLGVNGVNAPTPANVEAIKSAWFALMIIGGQVILPIVLLTMLLSKNVRRSPALINMIIFPIALSIIACMLLYAGQARGPEPHFGLCLAQASFMYGIIPATFLAAAILVLEIWYSLRAVTFGKELEEERTVRARNLMIVLPPYGIFLIFMTASLMSAWHTPDVVTRSRSVYYCSIRNHLDVGASIVSVLLCAFVLVFETWVMVILYTKWDSSIAKIVLPHTILAFNVKLIKRVMALSIVFSLTTLPALFEGVSPGMVLVPRFNFAIWVIGIAIVFASQPSILRVWCFWNPRQPRTELDSYATSFDIVSSPGGVTRTNTHLSVDTELFFGDGFGGRLKKPQAHTAGGSVDVKAKEGDLGGYGWEEKWVEKEREREREREKGDYGADEIVKAKSGGEWV